MHEKSVIGQLPEEGGGLEESEIMGTEGGGGMKIREYRKGTEMCRLLLGKEVGEIEGRGRKIGKGIEEKEIEGTE